MPTNVLTTSEVADLLQVSPSAVSRMVSRGELSPNIKAPGVRGPMFFDADEVERVRADREARTAEVAR